MLINLHDRWDNPISKDQAFNHLMEFNVDEGGYIEHMEARLQALTKIVCMLITPEQMIDLLHNWGYPSAKDVTETFSDQRLQEYLDYLQVPRTSKDILTHFRLNEHAEFKTPPALPEHW